MTAGKPLRLTGGGVLAVEEEEGVAGRFSSEPISLKILPMALRGFETVLCARSVDFWRKASAASGNGDEVPELGTDDRPAWAECVRICGDSASAPSLSGPATEESRVGWAGRERDGSGGGVCEVAVAEGGSGGRFRMASSTLLRPANHNQNPKHRGQADESMQGPTSQIPLA